MADEGTFCTTAEVGRKAGANASATSIAEAYTNDFVKQAESYINSVCRINFHDLYATLTTHVKMLLKEAASDLAAMYAIQYDMSGFSSLDEAETMLDVLFTRATQCLSLLKNKEVTTFIQNDT